MNDRIIRHLHQYKHDTLHIDDLDGAITLFKSTDEGTETIAVFDEEYREAIEYLVKEVNCYQQLMLRYYYLYWGDEIPDYLYWGDD